MLDWHRDLAFAEIGLERILAEPSPGEALFAVLRNMAGRMPCGSDACRGRGCLFGNFALELATGTEPVRRKVQEIFMGFRFLHEACGYPLPHFGVSFPVAYGFARLMETVSRVTPWDPFITRSVVLLLEETAADNDDARRLLGYEPQVHWKDAIRAQLAGMRRDRVTGLPMARPLPTSSGR